MTSDLGTCDLIPVASHTIKDLLSHTNKVGNSLNSCEWLFPFVSHLCVVVVAKQLKHSLGDVFLEHHGTVHYNIQHEVT